MPLKDKMKKAMGKLTKKNKDPVNKAKKKKWSKGKVREKFNNFVFFNKVTYDKFCKEVPNYKLITLAVVSKRLKIQGFLEKDVLQDFCSVKV